MKRFSKRAVSLTLAALIGLSPMAAASEALGDDLHTGSVALAPGVEMTRQIFWGNSKSDLRTERYLTYTPNAGVYPTVVYGNKVLDKLSLSAMAQQLEAQGHRVVGGVNGDFFDMSTGNTLGVLISDGVLRSTSGGFYAVGFRDDGSAFIGWPAISVTTTFSGYTLQVTDVNKTRTALTDKTPGGYYLYTADYNKTTQNTSPGIDVILTPVTDNLGQEVSVDLDVSGSDGKPVQEGEGAGAQSGEPQTAGQSDISDSQGLAPGESVSTNPGEIDQVNATLVQSDQLRVGGRVTCTVDQVLESTTAIDIPQGKMVLTINKQNNEWLVGMAANLKPGDKVDIDVTSTDTRWNSAATALGGFYRIVSAGQVVSNATKAATPRTAVGIKADGTVVIYTIDGNQAGYSVGATLEQVAQRLVELGCVEAICLDGGGSTTMGATLPTKDAMEIVNRPSEGSLRAVSTGLFLVSDLKATGELDHLYVSPYDSILLSGASVPLYATAMDSSYYPMTYSGDITWSISNGDGTVSADGIFTAGAGNGSTKVTATAGTATGTAGMTVVKTPDSITLADEATGTALTSLALEPNESMDLKASSVYKKLSLVSQDTCYTWTADPGLGTVDENGVFTAGPKSATGNLTVSAGGKSVSIPVTVAGHVTRLEDFEVDTASLTGTNAVAVTAEKSSDYVRFGKQSAKLAYDAAASGTATVLTTLPIAEGERCLTLWVYGDGTGNALTATVNRKATAEELAGGSADTITEDVVLTGLDFTGWKRITAQLPENASGLSGINIIYGGAEGAGTGVLWLDQLTTSNEDFVDEMAPVVALQVSGTKLAATVSDNVDKSFTAADLSLTLDGAPLSFDWNAEKKAVTAVLPASDGKLHRVTLTATDQSGNIGRASFDITPAVDPAQPADPGPFTDMSAHWAKSYTTYLYDMGVTNGVDTADGRQFQPEKNITRGEFALMVARWMGLDLTAYSGVELPFADKASIPAWMLDGMKAMYDLGILKGSLEGGVLVSRATATISRAEAMTILGRIQPKGYPEAALNFDDASGVAAWALPHVQSLVGQGVVSGYDGLLRPSDPVKRSEVAKMLFAIL